MTTAGREGRLDDPSDIREVRTAVEFAARLSDLRRASGRSLRNLSEAITAARAEAGGEFVHASYSTLGEWCRGDRLPQLTHIPALECLLGELGVTDTEPWLEVLAQVRHRSTRGGEDAAPYKGLSSFSAEDREWFFGRSELTSQVVASIGQAAGETGPGIVWVVGASGSGKSSLLHAGVVPVLEDEGWTSVSMVPGPNPGERLATATSSTGPEASGNSRRRSLLLVDAFEEVFSQVDGVDERGQFVRRLAEVSEHRTVVCAVRIDFFADVADLPVLGRTLTDSQVLVRPMRVDELREAIAEPAAKAGGSIDEELVEVLVRELVPADGHSEYAPPGALPLVSFALSETWRLRRRGRMTLSDYLQAGGLGGAVRAAAEQSWEDLTPRHQDLVRQVFLRMVHITATTETRRHVEFSELAGLDEEMNNADDVIGAMEPFIASRLLTIDDQTIRLTHEAVLSAWPRLQEWIDTDRAAMTQQRSIAAAASHWLELDRDRSALATGRRLAAMSHLAEAATTKVRLSKDEQAFLDASEAQAAAENETQKRRGRVLRAATGVAVCLAVVAGVLATVANRSRSDAVAARQDALSRQIAITAEGLVGRDLSMAQQLAVAAYEVAPTAEARATLLDLGALPHPARYLAGAGSTAVAIAPSGDWFAVTNNLDATVQLFARSNGGYERAGVLEIGEPGVEVYALTPTPDETVLAVGDTTSAITLWDVADLNTPTELASLTGPAGPVQKIAVSPDGDELVAAGATPLWQTDHPDEPDPVDAVIRWDISDPADPEPLSALPLATEVTWAAAYSDDGSLLVVGDEEGRVSLWRTGAQPTMLSHIKVGERSTVTVAISGDTVATGNRSAELGIWNISNPEAPTEIEITPPEFSTWVNAVSFSPDGDRFVAGGSDTVLQVWETTDWRHASALPHPDPITQTAFTDAGTLITGAVDGTARLWDIGGDLPERMIGIVGDSSFTADGTRAAALSGWDAAVWDTSADDGRLERVFHELGDDLAIGSGSISPDGSMLAYGTIDGLVRLYDLNDPSPQPVDLPNGTGSGTVQSAYFSADNQVLAAGGDDTNVRLWDLSDPDSPELSSTIDAPSQIVLQTTWSPSGRTLVIASAEGAIYLYDATDPADPQALGTIEVLDSEAYTTTFTPDGSTLAVAGTESDVWIFDVTDPTDPRQLGNPIAAPNSRIYDLAFDGDGSQLAAAATDGTVWIWDTTDAESPEQVATLGPRDDSMFTVAWHPTQNRLLGSGVDPTVLYWDLDVERVIDQICLGAGDVITEEEWTRHLPSEPYAPPCTGKG